MTSEEGSERRNRVINTIIGSEVGLNVCEKNHGTISSSAFESTRLGEANGVVEGQAKGLMDVFAALTVEQRVLQVIAEGEEDAALIGNEVLATRND